MASNEWVSIAHQERMIILEHQRAFPVKLSALAASLGLRVVSSTLPTGISGELRPSPDGFVISVNRHDSPRRQRFTVAHEIAHYLLHRDQIGAGISDDVLYRSNLSDVREAEANRLAAEVLMPRDEVDRLWDSSSAIPIEQRVQLLADKFEVSEVAMRIRLGLP